MLRNLQALGFYSRCYGKVVIAKETISYGEIEKNDSFMGIHMQYVYEWCYK